MILSGIKKAAIKRKVKTFLENRKELHQAVIIKSAGIIVDVDRYPTPNDFLDLKKTLSLDELQIVEFSEEKKEPQKKDNLFFTPKKITMNGTIMAGELKDFSEKEYDLLISYTNIENPAFNLITAASRAGFKIGVNLKNEELYDLIIRTGLEDVEGFKKEVAKYLRILKMLNNE